jgi:hypothetical protein
LSALPPLQAPEATQELAFVALQINVELPPVAMVPGSAEIVTTGGAADTVTVADCAALPPGPVQVRV